MPDNIKHISFLKYNNYANRTHKPNDGWDEIMGVYDSSTHRYSHEIARIDDPKLWNPNDGVTTVIVTPLNVDFSTEPDYLTVWWSFGSHNFESRWFVTETVRLQAGQYQCHLRRDVFAEAWNELTSATCNIYRAIASRYDSIIYNNEPVDVNQILESEMEIKDNTGCPWIVFYGSDPFRYEGENPDTPLVVSPSITYDIAIDNVGDITGTPDAPTGTRQFLNKHCLDISFCWRQLDGLGHSVDRETMIKPSAPHVDIVTSGTTRYNIFYPNEVRITDVPAISSYWDDMWNEVKPVLGYSSSDEVLSWGHVANSDRIIFCTGDNKYYKLTANSPEYIEGQGTYVVQASDTALVTVLGNAMRAGTNLTNYVNNANNFVINYKPEKITFTLTEVQIPDQVTVRIPAGYMPDDNPYYIWCMPYGEVPVEYNGTTYYTDPIINRNIASAISRAYSRTKITDVQIVPYCPLKDEFFKANGSIDGDDNMLTKGNCILDNNNGIKGFIFCLPYSSFETQIMLDNPITVSDPKFESMTKMWRLYSPNYGSTFEFSVPKNGGLTGFNVRATYMPISPYIRVAPIWGGLYGEAEFKYDTRGLILGGDYSIARIDDKWVEYKENNKNYAAIFDRQIDNMDVMRGIQREQERWGVAAGLIQGATTGAMAGSAAGPWGALAGGAVGGVGAAITGMKDIELNERAYTENRSYATDMHNLQLQNVAAMPRSIAKTTAFNIDNRYFPIFATYKCTEQEERAAALFIINRSMTIGRIGSPSEFLNNTWSWDDGAHNRHARGFIQGSIININTVHDTHFVDALNDEFSKGVYTR